MTAEFNLSEKEQALGTLAGATYGTKIYYPEDVKEFIRLLKEKFGNLVISYLEDDNARIETGNFFINKLAGDALK